MSVEDLRIIAVDWSGAMVGERARIWLAEVAGGEVLRLEGGRSRQEVAHHLVEHAVIHPELVVGLDFAFSMPAWFVRKHGARSATEFWSTLACGLAEQWLREAPPPFWGRAGSTKPRDTDPLIRVCDQWVGAKSVFQIAGAGAVGTGSLRGMPALHQLREHGFAVWPFDTPRRPLAIEIYPRAFARNVRRARHVDMARHLAHEKFAAVDESFRAKAEVNEHAFDALVSALAMWRDRDDLQSLPEVDDDQLRLEGIVWHPRWREQLERG